MSIPADIVPISLPTPLIVGPVNAFLIKSTPLTLVDTGPGTEDCYVALQHKLGEHGIAVRDLEAILVTHGHIDHLGLLARLVAESGAKTYGHESVGPHAAEYFSGEESSRQFLAHAYRQFGVPESIIAQTVQARDEFKRLGEPPHIDFGLKDGADVFGFDVIHVPGHSASDTLFFSRERQVMFAGDHVLKGVNPTPLIRRDPHSGERVKSMLQYVEALQRTRALNSRIIYPGHGAPITNPDEIIARIQQRHDRRTQQVLDFTRERPMTPHEVSVRLFPSLAPEHTYLGLSTAIGHLDVLEAQAFVCAEAQNDVYYYAATI